MIKYPFPVKYVTIKHNHHGSDMKLAYCDEGKGPQTLLFIHGLANYIPVFKHNIEFLKKHFRCVAVDLPGNGLSSSGDYPFSMLFYAETISRFIEHLNLKNVVLVGHSMGGQISVIIALRFSHLIKKLVLLAPSGFEYFSDMEKSWVKGLMRFGSFMYSDAMSLESAIINSYYHEKKQDAHHIINDLKHIMLGEQGKYWGKMTKANIEGMLDEQVSVFLPEIKQKTLLLYGKQDALIPNKVVHFNETTESLAKKSAALIENCEYHIIPHCGHFIQIEAADKVNDLILKFLT
ncbi:MAG: alpha/beta hydrolase [Bacteroidota bacterium]|nr:alpha/beta hydrolase [Bacteroidota bacterium]